MKWPQFESALKSGSAVSMSQEGVPSLGVLDTVKQLGNMVDGHDTVLNNIQELQVGFHDQPGSISLCHHQINDLGVLGVTSYYAILEKFVLIRKCAKEVG